MLASQALDGSLRATGYVGTRPIHPQTLYGLLKKAGRTDLKPERINFGLVGFVLRLNSLYALFKTLRRVRKRTDTVEIIGLLPRLPFL